jgi:hypothetical protein
MNENILELHELDELKAAYNLMDERLDGQEIVSDEQLHEAMMRKFNDIRESLKEGLIWTNLLFVPALAWWAWATSQLTLFGIILLSVYWVASLIFRFVILRRTKKEDYGSYDLKTLVEKESSYAKNIKWGSIVTLIFFAVFFLQMFIGQKTSWIIFVVMTSIFIISFLVRWLVIKYKYNGQAIDPATGKSRVLGSKWITIFMYVVFGLVLCLYMSALVMNVVNGVSVIGLMSALNGLSYCIAIVVLILGILHQREKINVSRRLLIILAAIAIALSVSIAGIATLKGFTELTQGSHILITVASAGLGLSFHKMRKK